MQFFAFFDSETKIHEKGHQNKQQSWWKKNRDSRFLKPSDEQITGQEFSLLYVAIKNHQNLWNHRSQDHALNPIL